MTLTRADFGVPFLGEGIRGARYKSGREIADNLIDHTPSISGPMATGNVIKWKERPEFFAFPGDL
jgi:hypothetical protein